MVVQRVGQQTLPKAWSKELTVAMQTARAEAVLCNILVERNLPFLLMVHLPGVLSHAFLIAKLQRRLSVLGQSPQLL